MINWLWKKPKQSPRKDPTFGPQNRHDTKPGKPIDEMSVSEVIEIASTFSTVTTFKQISPILQRLYNIAFFDHGVAGNDRRIAEELIVTIKDTVLQQLANDPTNLEAFQRATQFTEGQIALSGTGSLAWLLVENEIPGGDTIPFIMKPEYSTRLAPFLKIMDVSLLNNIKHHLVRELVTQRHGTAYPNTVLHLHGMACNGEPATHAIFSASELDAFIHAPYDYQSARDVLANLGLLTAQSNALPLVPSPKDGLLMFIVSQSAIDSLNEMPPDHREAVPPPEGMDGLDQIVPLALCLHLGLTMLESLYGAEKRLVAMDGIEAQFRKAADAGLLSLVGIMKKLENLASTQLKESSQRFTFDQLMVFAAWQEFGLWPDTEDQWHSMQPYLSYLSHRIRHIRTDYLIRVRFYIRFFNHGRHEDTLSTPAAVSEIRKTIGDLYVQYGSRAGVIETAAYGEDWIGLSS